MQLTPLIFTIAQDAQNSGRWDMLLSLMPVVGIALILVAIVSSIRKRQRRAAQGEVITPRENLERGKQRHGIQDDMTQLMVEVEQLSRRFSAQLDAKRLEMEKLLRQADAKIQQLRDLQQSSPDRAKSASPPRDSRENKSSAKEAPETVEALPEDPLARSVYELADKGLEPTSIADRLGEHVGKVELILALRAV